ncbi:MAG: type IV secretion system protein, partial [Janthinobacterium lividum]
MKRVWLGTVFAGALLWGGAANALDIVSDPLVEANTLQALAKEAIAAQARVTQITNQLTQIQHAIATVNAVSHGNLAALADLSPELGGVGLTSPLGSDSAGLVSALGGLGGSVMATGSLAQQMMSTDNYYLPQVGDFRAVTMNQAAAALAQQRALASLALDSNTRRLASLTTLRNQLGSTADVKAAADA